MERFLRLVLTALLLLGISACASLTPAAGEVAATQPTSTEGFHPLTTRTGIEEIDHVLDTVAGGDTEALRSLIQLTNAKCTQRDGLGGPPKCREGETEGTPVEVLPFLGPEGSYLRSDEIGNWPGFEASGIYAIYEVSQNAFSDENNPAGKYAIMFLENEYESAVSLRTSGGRIVRVDFIFDTSPEVLNGWLQRESSNVILAPVK